PHGFELAGTWLPEALAINDRFYRALAADRISYYADDHVVGHHAWNYLLAWRDYVQPRPATELPQSRRLLLEHAQVLVDRRDGYALFVGLKKGGVFKLYKNDQLLASDTQWSLRVKRGRRWRNAVGHLTGSYPGEITPDRVVVTGRLGWSKNMAMTPWRLLLLRAAALSLGRFFPNQLRWLIQKMMITGKNETPFEMLREFVWQAGAWHVNDELRVPRWRAILALGRGGYQTSTYTIMTRFFSKDQLASWQDLSPRLKTMQDGQPLRIERSF
ncbi:MAG: hypothetical protein NTV49_03005, partial [Kiritimatiellaeota bacterium]|nr:hypothetical protein [Kiritimatiellota bacterium]